MPRARQALVSRETTPYYHCVSRCVRRAFLCGTDSLSGKCFEHRRGWIEARLLRLAELFALDVVAYAIMSNHHHVILRLTDRAEGWSMDEVLARWCELFAGPLLVRRYRAGESLSEAELAQVAEYADEYRARFSCLSWFMRCLNEPIARWANAEDGCSGRFWEGRFKSQALLDEQALLTCMAYVDLNPVRARLAATPEASEHTSIQHRIRERHDRIAPKPGILLPFVRNTREEGGKGVPFRFEDYLALVDWTGRVIREDKRGAVPGSLPPILVRLKIEPQAYLSCMARSDYPFLRVVGRVESIQRAAHELGQAALRGVGAARALFEAKPG